ncbi:MAG: hypothetical protein NC321_02635 [Clostridium sp.]|nr:hypothetical protein [Clostridium sp.]
MPEYKNKKSEAKMSQENKNLIEVISRILVRENQITQEEQLRIIELLKKEK